MSKKYKDELNVLLHEYDNVKKEQTTYITALYVLINMFFVYFAAMVAITYYMVDRQDVWEMIYYLLAPGGMNLLFICIANTYAISDNCKIQLFSIEVTINDLLLRENNTAPLFTETRYLFKNKKFGSKPSKDYVPGNNNIWIILMICYLIVVGVYIYFLFKNIPSKEPIYYFVLCGSCAAFIYFSFSRYHYHTEGTKFKKCYIENMMKWDFADVKNVFYKQYYLQMEYAKNSMSKKENACCNISPEKQAGETEALVEKTPDGLAEGEVEGLAE